MNTNKALSVMSEDYVERDSAAVSVMTVVPPRRVDMALSARSQTQISVRDMNDMVTEGRFAPAQFNAEIQTDRELIVNFLRRETAGTDMCTEPIKFLPEKEFAQIMIQTDEMIYEPELTHEPNTIEWPVDPPPVDLIIPMLHPEGLYELELP